MELKKEIDILMETLPRLTGFVLPGKNIMEAQIHIARSVARRAERLFYDANEEQVLCPRAAEYLNKLSDYLFALSQLSSV
jgi:cob(I)alamin adenosyltransferase